MADATPPKEVLQKLKDWLQDRKYNYTTSVTDGGGCPTCGYGANEYEVVDGDKLLAEIDAFSATFKK